MLFCQQNIRRGLLQECLDTGFGIVLSNALFSHDFGRKLCVHGSVDGTCAVCHCRTDYMGWIWTAKQGTEANLKFKQLSAQKQGMIESEIISREQQSLYAFIALHQSQQCHCMQIVRCLHHAAGRLAKCRFVECKQHYTNIQWTPIIVHWSTYKQATNCNDQVVHVHYIAAILVNDCTDHDKGSIQGFGNAAILGSAKQCGYCLQVLLYDNYIMI